MFGKKKKVEEVVNSESTVVESAGVKGDKVVERSVSR